MTPSNDDQQPTGADEAVVAGPTGEVDCRELFEKLDLFLDRELPQAQLDRFEMHLAVCLPCAGRTDFENQLRAVVRDHCADQAPDQLVELIRARLELRTGR